MTLTNTDYESQKSILISSLKNLSTIASQVEATASCVNIEKEIHKISEERFHLVVLGQFKRGKTTFINAILGEQLLPVAVVPLTSVVTLIRYGEGKQIDVVFEETGRKTISKDELWEYVTEKGNPMNEKKVLYVEIKHPSDFLREGIVLIDTPGIGSMFLHNTETTYEFIPNIDAGILVLSPDPPLTQTEYEFLEDVKKYVDHLFLVLNKVDLITPKEMQDVVAYIGKVLQNSFPALPPIFPISARLALEAKEKNDNNLLQKSQLLPLVGAITTFLKENKGLIMLKASKNRILEILNEIKSNLELQIKTLQTPLIELENKIREFNKEANRIKMDREEFSYLLQGKIKSIQERIDEEIHSFGAQLSKQLQKSLLTLLDPIKDLREKAVLDPIKQKVQKMMIDEFEKWRSVKEPELRSQYEEIIREYAEKVNQCIKKLIELSTQIFDVRIAPFVETTALKWKQTFTYKVGADPLLFDIDTFQTFGRFLPSRFVRRKQVQQILDELTRNVSQNCGRLSYEYRYSMQESYRMFQYELNAKLDQILVEMRKIFDKAVQRKETDAKSTEEVVKQLTELLEKLHEIELGLG